MSMGLHEDQTTCRGDVAALRNAARDGRAAAMSRRRALAAGRTAPAPGHERARNASRAVGLRAPEAAGGPTPAVSDGQGARAALGATPIAIDGVAAGRLGRALSMQRRRQLSKGKQALGGDRTAAAAGAGPPVLIVHRSGAR